MTGLPGEERNVKNAWPYIVSAIVLAIAGGYIAHLRLSPMPDLAIGHSIRPPQFGKPRERTVKYEVTGPAGARTTLSYMDEDGQPRDISTTLPWSQTVKFHALTIPSGVVVQTKAAHIGCRIIIDGEVRDEQSSSNPDAAVSCTVVVA